MLGFIEGVNRNQRIMFPESLDEYLGDDNPVRFIDAFVDSLSLEPTRVIARRIRSWFRCCGCLVQEHV